MIISGKLIKGTVTISEVSVSNNDKSLRYTDKLEWCLLKICKELDIQVPLWLKKNTKEYSKFRRTFFFEGQFNEKVMFDRFEIKQIE